MVLTYPNLLDPFPYFSDLVPAPAAFAALLADGEASNLTCLRKFPEIDAITRRASFAPVICFILG